MAFEVQHFQVSIPASTPQATPATVGIAFEVRRVERIDWRVPRGPQGLMGFRLSMGGQPVVPRPRGTYMVADGEAGTWTLDDLPDSGAWQVQGYNTGANAHLVFVTFHVGWPAGPQQQPVLWTYGQLAPVPDLSHAGPPVYRR